MYLQGSCFYLQTEGVVWSFQKFLYLTFNTNIKYLWFYSLRFPLPLVSHGMQILNKNFRNKKKKLIGFQLHTILSHMMKSQALLCGGHESTLWSMPTFYVQPTFPLLSTSQFSNQLSCY